MWTRRLVIPLNLLNISDNRFLRFLGACLAGGEVQI